MFNTIEGTLNAIENGNASNILVITGKKGIQYN